MKKISFLKLIKLSILLIVIALVSIYFSNKLIENNAKTKTFTSIKNIPKNKVGLVLGTSKLLRNGNINFYYKYRLRGCY